MKAIKEWERQTQRKILPKRWSGWKGTGDMVHEPDRRSKEMGFGGELSELELPCYEVPSSWNCCEAM
jgi:hypothetical protein